MKLFKKVFRVVGVIIIIALGYVLWDQSAARSEMQKACSLAAVGEDIGPVMAKLTLKGFKYLRFKDEKELILISTSKGFGRFHCSIEHKDNKVIQARIVMLD